MPVIFSGIATTIGGWMAALSVSSALIRVVKTAFALVVLSIYVGATYAFFEVFTTLYTVITQMINHIETGGGTGGIIDHFYCALNASGVTAGINSVKAMVLSAVALRVVWILGKHFAIFAFVVYITFSNAVSA